MALGTTTDRTAGGGGIYLGTVTRVTGATCYVECPRYAAGFELGPAPYPADGVTPGDRVALAFLEGSDTDVVVLVRLA